MEETKSEYLYIVFTGTQCKIGSFIRAVTHGKYGHASVSLDSELSKLYSFARFKFDAPFFAGFVHEGAERYRQGDKIADVSVCRVNVGEGGVEKVTRMIEYMNDHTDDYLYNLISAVFVPFRKKIKIRDSYTCVEFTSAMLDLAGVKLSDSYSAMDLYDQLKDLEVYSGKYPENAPMVDNSFYEHISISRRISDSAKQFGRLTKRLVSH